MLGVEIGGHDRLPLAKPSLPAASCGVKYISAIESVQPLFQRIYSRMDPHPTFRLTQIVTALERGRGLLRTGISDPVLGSAMHDALPILSSSQLNSFAVSLFLALNLGLPSMRLSLVMLDDPLQSLD